MTSNRDFDKDKEWSHLRPSAGKGWLIFEDQGDASYELVVPVDWPTRVSYTKRRTPLTLQFIDHLRVVCRINRIVPMEHLQQAISSENIQLLRMPGCSVDAAMM
jgi:hypothetical protein